MATVTKPKKVAEGENGKEERNPLLDAAHKVLLAAVGAVGLAQDEIEDFVDKLVERGEIAEKDGRKLIKDIMERRKKEVRKTEDELGKRVEDVLDRMNVPTKSDIDALGEKIAELTRKVDELKRAKV